MQTTNPPIEVTVDSSGEGINPPAELPIDPGSAPMLNPATHPQAARDLIQSAYQLAGVDPDVGVVLNRALAVILSDMIWERAQVDDAFAMRAATILMQSQSLPTTPPAPPKVPRGKQGVKGAKAA